MKLFYVLLFFIATSGISTEDSTMNFQINGQSYSIPNFADIEGLLPDRKPTTSKKLDFEKIIYIVNEEKQKLQKGYKIPFSIAMTQEITVKGNFEMVDVQKSDMASYFQVNNDKEKVSVEIKNDISEEQMKKIHSLIFILKFIPEQSKEDFVYTNLVIFLQDEQPDPPTKINFDETNYKINIYPEYIGIMRQFVAKLDKNDGKTTIKYNLIFENDKDDILKNSLTINELTGILEKTKPIQPGQHTFEIAARINDEIHNEIEVTLNVKHAVICDSEKSKFFYAQVVKHFPEGQTGDILDPLANTDDGCVYKIASQEPEGDYFQLDEKTAGLKLQKGVNLDANIFKDPKNPKFLIKLYANCGTKAAEDDKTKKDTNQAKTAYNYLDIPYNPNEMTLILYIDKSTPSVFSTENILVGYPKEYDVIMNYNVPLVTSVLTCTNEPTNAIRYSIVEENCPFAVHPSKGDIYPLNFYNSDKDYTFTILAKDGSRKTEGKLSVTIKFLTEKELVEAIFIDTAVDFDKLLQDCSAKVGMKIKPLTRAIVPITDEVKKSNKISNDNEQTRLWRALCYAIDEIDQNYFVKGKIIVDKLKSSSYILNAEMVSVKIADSNGQDDQSCSFILIMSGIIAAVLALAFITIVIYLFFLRRKTTLMRRNNVHISAIPLDDDMEAPSRWISSQVNVFDSSRTASYSNTNQEVIMENRTQTTSNDLMSSSVSSFRPDTSIEHHSSTGLAYHDLEFPPATASESFTSSCVHRVSSSSSKSTNGTRKKINDV